MLAERHSFVRLSFVIEIAVDVRIAVITVPIPINTFYVFVWDVASHHQGNVARLAFVTMGTSQLPWIERGGHGAPKG